MVGCRGWMVLAAAMSIIGGLLGTASPAAAVTCSGTCSFTYAGGALEPSTTNVVVRWGANVSQSSVDVAAGLLRDLDGSGYLAGLSEYSVSGQTLTAGASYAGTFAISPSVAGATVSDAQIQTELKAQIGAGQLPSPTATTNYVVMFPAGDTITYAGGSSLSTFCSYHDSTTLNSTPLRYIVLPDFNNATAVSSCPPGNDYLQITTSNLSHQLVEAITDPVAGGSWYDNNNGEIADPCSDAVSPFGQVGTYVVQSWWSNAHAGCSLGNATILLRSHPPTMTNQTGASFTYTDSDPYGHTPTFTCQLDATTPTSCQADTAVTYTGLPDGSHTVTVTGTDNAHSLGTATFTWTVDTSPPSVTITSAPAASSSSSGATFSFTGSDPDGGALSFACSLDGGAATSCASPQVYSGLPDGTHTWAATVTDAAGNASTTTYRWIVDTTVPTARMTAPAAPFTLSTSLRAAWIGADAGSGVASYDVRYMRSSGGAFSAWAYPSAWQQLHTTSVTMSVPRGWEYCFSVRARDVAGNVSGWTPAACSAVPLDDRALTTSTGWSRRTHSGYYANTYSVASSYGATLQRRITGGRFALVATRCSMCGSVTVAVNGHVLKKVSLYARTTQRRWTIAWYVGLRSGTLTIRIISRNQPVQIDGFGISRT